MTFTFLEFHILDDQWWLSICAFEFPNHQPALLHIEYDQGAWKFDLLGLRELYYWNVNK